MTLYALNYSSLAKGFVVYDGKEIVFSDGMETIPFTKVTGIYPKKQYHTAAVDYIGAVPSVGS